MLFRSAIDFGLLGSQPFTVAALLAGFLVIKLLTLWLAARIMGVTTRQRWLFAILLSQGGEFGFVVFGAAQLAGVLTREWSALLTMTVALSMATTPLLLLLHDWWLARMECARGAKEEADTIDEKEARVIIAGFGRFGQIVGRFLLANGVGELSREKLAAGVLLPASFPWHRPHWDACFAQYWRSARGFDPAIVADIKAMFGFDKPPLERFLGMARGYLTFDLGRSFFRDATVGELVRRKLPVSISLGLWSTLLVYAVSIPLGIAKAVRDGSRFDVATSAAILVGYAVPGFLFAILLVVVFAGGSFVQWFPLRGLTSSGAETEIGRAHV